MSLFDASQNVEANKINFIMKLFHHQLQLWSLIVLVLLATACAHDHSDGHDHDHGAAAGHAEKEAHDHGSGEEEEGEIHLSREQIKTVDITFGDFSPIKINDYISATGTLGLPPNAYSSVSAKASGFIQSSKKFVEGNYIKKGVVLAYLENIEFIEHQKAYLEVSADLQYAKQELERQQALLNDNAGVLLNVQKLQAEVLRKTATQKATAKQLEYLGIEVAKVSADNIVERIALVSPMSGFITSIQMHNGMYVEPNRELMEIVNENHLHLELDIFEKDIAQIAEGQKITYTVPALGGSVYDGEVHVLGKEFNSENKTVRIHGHLEKERPTFIKDLFIEAKIWLNDQTVQALPEEAIVKDGASSYIYVANETAGEEEVKFEARMVMPGITDKGFTSVKLMEEIPEGMKIVTSGAYFVYAQSKAGELEHHH